MVTCLICVLAMQKYDFYQMTKTLFEEATVLNVSLYKIIVHVVFILCVPSG